MCHDLNLPMKPSGQSTRALCALECDLLSGWGSNLSQGMSAYKIIISKIIPMHMMNREITLGRKRGFNGVLYNL